MSAHEHQWGPVEIARMTGNPHRKCTGCRFISLDIDDEEDDVSTSAQRNENRLSAEDREAMNRRINDTMHQWPHGFIPKPGSDFLVLKRVAANAIGCGFYDLRDSELDEIDDMVAAAVEARY